MNSSKAVEQGGGNLSGQGKQILGKLYLIISLRTVQCQKLVISICIHEDMNLACSQHCEWIQIWYQPLTHEWQWSDCWPWMINWHYKNKKECISNFILTSSEQLTLPFIKRNKYSTKSRHLSSFQGIRISNEHLYMPGLPLVNASQLIT